MPPDSSAADRRAARVGAVFTARRALRSGAIWGAVFGLYVVVQVAAYATTFSTAASRAKLAQSLGANAGLSALIGPALHLETVAGYTAWRTVGVLTVVGAVWGLLIGTRLTRGEEDAGRWELLLTGQTTRRRAAAQAVFGLAAGIVALWAVTAVATVAEGSSPTVRFTTGGSLLLATTLVAGAATFLAVGVLVAQLAPTRRQANGAAAGVLGVSYLVRMVADSASGLAWLRWASPLGWPEEIHPLIGSRLVGFVPIVVLVTVLPALAIVVAGRRDVGAGALPAREAPPARTRLLAGVTGLSVRLVRPVATGWMAGLAVLGLVLGMVAQSAASAVSGSATIEKAIARLGGSGRGAAAYIGITLLVAAGLVAFVAAGQIAAARTEEADGHLDNLLVHPVSRSRWLGGRLAAAAALVVAAGAITGGAAWVGAASQHSGVGLGRLIQAGLNIAAPALFVLGFGTMVYGLWPRGAPGVTYGLVAWSFLVVFIGSVVKGNRLLLDSSVLTHITPAPAANPNWTSAGALVALGVFGAAIGLAAFNRRDLVTA